MYGFILHYLSGIINSLTVIDAYERKKDAPGASVEGVTVLFRPYSEKDYEMLCDFLVELNRNDQKHINWNWARFEWMYEHPMFDKSAMNTIGLWLENEHIVGAAIYDLYFGEAFCGALPFYEGLYPDIFDYAYRALKDDGGLGVCICDDDTAKIKAAEDAGFIRLEQAETVMSLPLHGDFAVKLPDGWRFAELDPVKEPYAFQWLLWQGFDHGTDKDVFEQTETIAVQHRRHFNPYLSVAVVNESGEKVAYCCLWYHTQTDYAYVEPVCTVPSYRGKGAARAVVCEALNRARALGAKVAYVISDTKFYEKLGFETQRRFPFYWKA